MPIFPLNKIQSLALDRQTYLRGVSGYNAGWVKELSVTPEGAGLTATLTEGDKPLRVEVRFDPAGGGVHSVVCSCMRCRPGGACKHVVAALTCKYYTDMLETPAPITTPAGGPDTDPAARVLLDRYLSAASRRLAAGEPAQPVRLVALLSLDAPSPCVSFRVGDARLYQIKNLPRFARRFADGETVEYGKDLRLLHHPDRFTPESRPLLDFLLAELEDGAAFAPLAGGNLGELTLSAGAFDRLFAVCAETGLLLRTAAGERPLRLGEDAPTLTLTVEEEGEGLRFWSEPVQPVFGAGRRLYLLQGDCLLRTPTAYARGVGPWLEMAHRARGGFYVAPGDLPVFCATVLPAVTPHLRLQGAVERLESFVPPLPDAHIWLDRPTAHTVTARVTCTGRDLYRDPAPLRRDPLAEQEVAQVVERYFSPHPDEEGWLPFAGEEADLFTLLTQGVEALSRVATVVTTPAFDALLPETAPTLRAGVRLTEELLQVDLQLEGLDPTELAGIMEGYRAHRPYHRLKDGRFLPLEEDAVTALAELTDGLGLSVKDLQKGPLTLPKYRALYLDALLARRPAETVTRDRLFRQLAQQVTAAGEREYPLPPSLEGVLRDYQKAGFRWLSTMAQLGFGGILADDMGLGKTLQVLALLLADKEQRDSHAPSLVVCPTSVVLGWEREAARFTPGLSTLCVVGDAATRRALLDTAGDYDLVITSYDMLKRDVAAYQALSFRFVILDEAQYIKNSATQNARAVKTLRAGGRFALTGTPVENRLSELWSIFDFLMPGFLFSGQKFRARFEQPLLRGEDPRVAQRLGRLVGPFILRRLKGEVLSQLPEKTEQVLPTTMERPQRQVYLDALARLRDSLTALGDRRLTGKHRVTVLAQLTRLRQICCDPRLCCEGYTGQSCKLEACMELLRQAAAGGHKVLLFSQFTSMLAILKERLEAEGIPHYLLQGSTPRHHRAAMVDAFNADHTPVFLISLKAGGVGLNLTGADMVIHYDPWWNMAAQNQATDRAHRLGQTRPVQVVRLTVQDTVEENILQMQEDKWQLAKAVVDTQTPAITALTGHELLRLLEGE